ncbi:MAG: hypothetical protein IT183_06700 [Acidobacteria bacterium]|nr:hypothetical protein [Acidobacteriota bacterium]
MPLSDLAPMVPRTLETAWAVAWRREILAPSAVGTIVSFFIYRWVGTDAGVATLPVPALWGLSLAVGARFWLGLSISMTAVDILRSDRQWLPFYAVSPALAAQAAVVTLCLALPILAGTVFLIIPGAFLALRWSQALMLIADERARWFHAAEASVDLVHGQKLDIFAIWLIVGCALALATWFDAVVASMVSATGVHTVVSTALSLALRVGADAFSLALVGATYYQLDAMTERP